MKLLRNHPIALFAALAVLAPALAVLHLPGNREINVTLTATEYRLDDPDFAVEHTVAIHGKDTRNLLGKGRFEGAVSVSGLEELDGEQDIVLTFLQSLKRESRVSTIDREGFVSSGGGVFGPVFPSRDYSEFVWLLANEVHEDGGASYGGDQARFLISGPAGREDAFIRAGKLADGSFWESMFTDP